MKLTTFETELCERIVALESENSWATAAQFLAEPAIADWLIETSFRTPYTHLPGYMERFWLLNPYDFDAPKGGRELPSARIHHILRKDLDRHYHDHPWDARTVILKGWYIEERLMADGSLKLLKREPGDTAALNFGGYHRIVEVSEGGVWTLFITYQYRGTWGFLVDGKKVPWREYQASLRPGRSGMPATTAEAGA
jgi:hypothetical protein